MFKWNWEAVEKQGCTEATVKQFELRPPKRTWRRRAVQRFCMSSAAQKFILELPTTSIPPLRQEVVQVAKTATTHNSMLIARLNYPMHAH